ncbi:hypothetical protein [Cellulomonas alba]|uniref:PKD domain-containing protein n=1 Tax=Cellulomonas alba TaxID=3053467 RepID=A0ABT7SEP2_9CELL|nr:hypothetical protein [Cellulomonas alba]MDM7854646.1 hypothetical protein [Cellulomonas alba]
MAGREQSQYEAAHPDPAKALREYRRAIICGVDTGGAAPGPDFTDDVCPREGGPLPPSCDGQDPVLPLWVRARATPQSAWQPWQLVSGWACPGDLLPPFTEADFRRLPLAAPALTMQPARGWVLVNQDTIAFSANATQTLRTTLLGNRVTVVATPQSYTWDWGDGTRTTSAGPGHPYPHQDVAHTYTALGTRRITLTVTWTGTFQYAGQAAATAIAGTASTTASTAPFVVEERRGHLVSGTCDQEPHAPGC